jgi:hypothetical protein
MGAAAAKHTDSHDDVCALCEEVGELICCDGRCKRAFHRTCVPANNPPPPSEDGAVPCRRRWLCSDCRCHRMRCFYCKRWGSTHDMLSCGRRTCGKFYHPECLAASLQPFSSLEQDTAAPLAAAAMPLVITAAKRGQGQPPSAVDAEDENDGGNEEDEDVAAAEAELPWSPPEVEDREGGDGTAGGCGAGCKAKARGGGKGKVLAVSCARHYCVHCLEVESAGYGKAMVRCVRCVTSYHRACLPRTPLTMITHASFLCHRCYNNSPRGLNAPDPTLPPTVHGGAGDADLIGDADLDLGAEPDLEIRISGEGPSLAAFAHAKLDVQVPVEFEQPADLLHALHARQLLPCNGFAPTPYKIIKQSVCLHKNSREALPATDSLACMCTLTNGGCDVDCQNKMMQQECLPNLCLCGDACGNRPFARHHENPVPLQLFKTAYKGWGVKLEQSCTSGELIVEYVGEVIDSASWEERKQQLSRFDHMYFMALNHNEIVDATRKGNIARFINHSCSPNLVVQKWFINRLPRLGLFATKDIPAGAEVTYNYSVKWSGDPDMAQRCYCEAPNCTGYLGSAPSSRGRG